MKLTVTKLISAIVFSFFHLCMQAQGNRLQCDESCAPGATGAVKYNVVSPVGFSTVDPIEMAPRLTSLNGKTIAIVGEDFMNNITHPELRRLIKEHYPTAKVIMYNELPIAGPYPAPGITRHSTEQFRQRLIDLKVDAVIAGNGGCGICTPKETGSCIVAERLGIPSVIVTAPGFDEEARYTARNNGVPVLRVAVYPGAFASHTEEQLVQNTREVTWPQIVEALTKPITQEEYAASETMRGITDDVYHGTLDEIYAYFTSMGWSDGAPFYPPTYEKVLTYLEYTNHTWNETIAVLPQAFRNTTTWHMAVNACMAGCKPEYMPILIAMTQAMAGGDFRRTLGSTHAWTPYLWHSRRSAYERALANYYANPGSRKDGGIHTFNQYLSHIVKSEGGKETSIPAWYDTQAKTMTTIPTMQKGATAFLVTGDASRNKVQTMPGGGFSTVRIDLPSAWDSLMAAKGYPRLTDMCIISK